MADKNFFETLTQYRLKVEKDGENILNVPGLFALPGLLIAPKLSLTGLIASPLLGLKIHVENETGEVVDMEDAVRKAAETVKESVTTTTKTLRKKSTKSGNLSPPMIRKKTRRKMQTKLTRKPKLRIRPTRKSNRI